jgi:hypothetical protein
MFIYLIPIKLFLRKKFVSKLIWVMNNFLTMECYRELCNRFYWKKLNPNTVSYRTRFWMIMLSVFSAMLLAFYYDPSDPTYTFKSGCIILLSALSVRHSYKNLMSTLRFYSKNTVHTISCLSFSILDSKNISLWRSQLSYLRTSSLRI